MPATAPGSRDLNPSDGPRPAPASVTCRSPRSPHRTAVRRHGFDDEQIECYRCLGEHIAHDVFGEVVDRLRQHDSERARQPHAEYVPRFFAAIQEQWTEARAGQGERLLAAS